MRVSLRTKLLIFAIILALIPLGISGNTLIRITQDELKNSANEELSFIADQLANDIDKFYQDTWLTPIMLIRNGVDDPSLGPREKMSLLTNGSQDVPDIVSLQLSMQGVSNSPIVTKDSFTEDLQNANLDPRAILIVPNSVVEAIDSDAQAVIHDFTYIPELETWLMSIIIPLENRIQGRRAYLSAQINMNRLQQTIENHPHNRAGVITLVNGDGVVVFDPDMTNISDWPVVQEATARIAANNPSVFIQPFRRPTGERMLTGVGFPIVFPWGVIVEEDEAHAYVAIQLMIRNLLIWGIIGFTIAALAGIFGAQSLSRPIREIGRVAQLVGGGDLNVRVKDFVLKSRDELGELGERMNTMIDGLRERFQLQKFVSDGTIKAIKRGGDTGIELGGERRRATVFFSDIRGFTAFSEKVEPEVVIEMLNTYLNIQAQIIRKYHGDVDKYVGDEVVAVFQGKDMVTNAIQCAIRIQQEMERLTLKHPEWSIGIGIGINTGDMVMGAMGSEERMDYTILGDNVNLGARLCAKASSGQILLSYKSYDAIPVKKDFVINKLEPISVKGKSEPIQIYEVEMSGNKED